MVGDNDVKLSLTRVIVLGVNYAINDNSANVVL